MSLVSSSVGELGVIVVSSTERVGHLVLRKSWAFSTEGEWGI